MVNTLGSESAPGVVLRPGGTATPDDLASALAIQDDLQHGLERVRKAADSWRTGLLAVLALIGTVTVVKGRESFASLAPVAQVLVGAALLLALLAGAVGSYRAMRAAFGEPGIRKTQGVLLWDQKDAADAVHQLRAAKWDFFLALPYLALAIALTWYGPEAAADPLALVRADRAGTHVCGLLVRGDQTGITINEDGSEKLIPFSELRSLTLAKQC